MTSSGVRNLRAMFENNSAASSPEPRGRSPARRTNADTDRPTSKVKASFFSVEPSGLVSPPLGTTKGTEHGLNSPDAQRRESFSISNDAGEAAVSELKKVVSAEKEAREHSSAIPEAVPEQAVESRDASTTPPQIAPPAAAMPNLGRIMKGSDFPEPQGGDAQEEAPPQAQPAGTDKIEGRLAALSLQDAPSDNPDKLVTGAQEEASLKPADPKDEAAISGGAALPQPTEVLPSTNASSAVSKAPESQSPPKTPSKKATATGAASAKKPAPISVAQASPAKQGPAKSPLPRSPGVSRWPKTPTTPRAAPAAAPAKTAAAAHEKPKTVAQKEAAKAPAAQTSRGSLRSGPSATTGGATAAKPKAAVPDTKKPAPRTSSAAPAPKSTTATSPAGFKKPKPKSPTRPVRLPSHLTAPTAASAAKHGEDAPSQKLARKPSVASRPAATKAAPPARKPAARASVAPSTEKRPASRASTVGGASDGFLARMMRPTASSASKTHDKPASPPRRGASVRAATRPKPAQESTLAKGKQKVGEMASKVKETIMNGHGEDSKGDTSDRGNNSSTSAGAADDSVETHEQTNKQAESDMDQQSELPQPTPESGLGEVGEEPAHAAAENQGQPLGG